MGYKYSDITGAVIGSAMKVHSALGNGFPEVIYQRSLAIEFQEQNISYEREYSTPLFYKGKPVGKRRVDFLIEDKVLVELKAVSEINETHFNQVLNYLKAYQLEIGLLLNFGENSLKFKRFINSKITD
ncbi:MAG TPA: GxxExxY protein [Balneolaceae bacterium]|nr:GxxExxY protein [Balneolaceae bacterium]